MIETIYQKAFHSNPNLIAIVRRKDDIFIEINETFARVLGYKVGEMLGKSLSDFVLLANPEDWTRIKSEIEKKGNINSRRISFINKSLRNIYLILSAEFVEIDGTSHILVIMQDVTRRKFTEEALMNRLRYEEGLAACSQILLTDAEDALMGTLNNLLTASDVSRVVIYENYYNNKKQLCMKKKYEASTEDMSSGNGGFKQLHLVYEHKFFRWQRELAKGKPIFGHIDSFPENEKTILKRQNILSILVIPIIIGEEWYGFIAFDDVIHERDWSLNDIRLLKTAAEMIGGYIKRKRTDEAIRKSEEQYRFLANSVKDVIWTSDLTMRITYATPSIEKLVGYTAEEMLNQVADKIITQESREQLRKILEREMASIDKDIYKTTEIELDMLRKDGSIVSTESAISILYDKHGRPETILGVTRDISKRKRAEAERESIQAQLRQSQKMEAIGTLAGGIAHDFNNILGGIFGYTELALRGIPETNPLNEYLKEITQAAKRASTLVKQMLTLSRKQDMEYKPINITNIINEAVKLIRVSLPATIEIHSKLVTKSDIVNANATQIHQVIMNLCTNAAYAMRDKAGKINIRLQNITKLDPSLLKSNPDLVIGPYLHLEVSDTGTGIPGDIIDKIFDPFFTTKEDGKGSGLGLSVIHGIIKSHNGSITVKSEANTGTIFNIFLPLAKQIYDKSEKDSTLQFTGGQESILLVDDEVVIVNMGKEILEELGYDVLTKTNSVEALEILKLQPDRFDVVITDYTMPNMSGADLSKEILKLCPDMPIILCTDFNDQISPKKAKSIGIREFLMKPITLKNLAEAIRRVLS